MHTLNTPIARMDCRPHALLRDWGEHWCGSLAIGLLTDLPDDHLLALPARHAVCLRPDTPVHEICSPQYENQTSRSDLWYDLFDQLSRTSQYVVTLPLLYVIDQELSLHNDDAVPLLLVAYLNAPLDLGDAKDEE